MRASHILILDPDAVRRDELVSTFRSGGHLPVPCGDPADAARALAVPGLELAVLALDSPGLDQTLLRQAVAPASPALPEPLDDVERRHIARTLAYTHGNKRRAAHLLGIARSTLLAKVRKYGLDNGGGAGD
jgi:DNA-binding NtrC family response regulator